MSRIIIPCDDCLEYNKDYINSRLYKIEHEYLLILKCFNELKKNFDMPRTNSNKITLVNQYFKLRISDIYQIDRLLDIDKYGYDEHPDPYYISLGKERNKKLCDMINEIKQYINENIQTEKNYYQQCKIMHGLCKDYINNPNKNTANQIKSFIEKNPISEYDYYDMDLDIIKKAQALALADE